jgi:hypothetical protein
LGALAGFLAGAAFLAGFPFGATLFAGVATVALAVVASVFFFGVAESSAKQAEASRKPRARTAPLRNRDFMPPSSDSLRIQFRFSVRSISPWATAW